MVALIAGVIIGKKAKGLFAMAFYSFVSMAIASLLYNLHLYETKMINMHKFVQEMVAGGFVALPFICFCIALISSCF